MLYCPGYKAFLPVHHPNLLFLLIQLNLLFPQLCSCIYLSIQTLTLVSELRTEHKKKERRKDRGFGVGFFFLSKIILESHSCINAAM